MAAPTTAPVNPGQTLGIVSLVTSLLGISLVGLITGIIGLNQSKKAGQSNGLAIAGIVIGAIGLFFGLLWFFFFVLAALVSVSN